MEEDSTDVEELEELEAPFKLEECDAKVESELEEEPWVEVKRSSLRRILVGSEVAGISVIDKVESSRFEEAGADSLLTTSINCCMFEVMLDVTDSTIRASKSCSLDPKSVWTASSLASIS